MKNIFDIIDYKFFQVFSGENRRIHAEIIMVISDYFKRNHTPYVDKEDLINHLTDYIHQRNFDHVLDDEGNDISKTTPREKANSKINLFKRNGWLIEEAGKNYKDLIQFDDNAVIILKALEDINNNSTPKEYTGYIYVINNLLKTFDYSQGVSLLERIHENTEILMNRLSGLNSSIKKYLKRLLDDDSEDAEKLLKTLLNDYQDNIINKAFSNLKLNDNPSKYKNQILSTLNVIRLPENMDQLIQNYRKTKISNFNDEEIGKVLHEQVDYVYEVIEMLQQTILSIDLYNTKYVKSTTSKLLFLISENVDVSGKIENILKLIKHQKSDEFYSGTFSLYKLGLIDSKSLYTPRVYIDKPEVIKIQEKPSIDETYVDEVYKRLFRDNRFSINKINEYVKELLKFQSKVKSSELTIHNNEDLTRLILIQLYAHHDIMCYDTITSDNFIIKNGVEFKDFAIIKRGDQNVK